jgi:hypothetical protein
MFRAQSLFMIRLEDGNRVIAQADELEAPRFVGRDADLESVANDLPAANWELVHCGLGRQNSTARQLHNFAVEVKLTNEGQPEFRLCNMKKRMTRCSRIIET